MNPLPQTRTAVVQSSIKGVPEIRHDLPLPPLQPDQVLLKITHVALQPCDFKIPARYHIPSAVIGGDYAARIVALGSSVPPSLDLHVGDRVYGGIHGNNPGSPNHGAFSEYAVVDAADVMKTPDILRDEVAASLATRFFTCALTFRDLGLVGRPTGGGGKGEVVLVYGGSTSVGQMIIQVLKMSGYTPITTCSPANFELVRSLGAAEVFNYKDPDYIDQVKSYSKRSLKHVVDCIAEAQTCKDCLAMISRVGGRYVGLEYVPEHWNTRSKTVKASYFFAWEALGKNVGYEGVYGSESDPSKREYGQKWMAVLQELVREGQFLDLPIQMVPGRFQGILDGLKMLENKKVSGKKLVISLEA